MKQTGYPTRNPFLILIAHKPFSDLCLKFAIFSHTKCCHWGRDSWILKSIVKLHPFVYGTTFVNGCHDNSQNATMSHLQRSNHNYTCIRHAVLHYLPEVSIPSIHKLEILYSYEQWSLSFFSFIVRIWLQISRMMCIDFPVFIHLRFQYV